MNFALPLETSPTEARSADGLPKEDGWQYEPKWDGFRCLAFKTGNEVDLRAKSGKPLGRYFPEVLAFLRQLKAERFVLDGELLIELDGHLAFGALQARLHPAESRIRKLAAETPARLMVFGVLADAKGHSCWINLSKSGGECWKVLWRRPRCRRDLPCHRLQPILQRRRLGWMTRDKVRRMA
jgi:ATP-dependent DNA ligase